MKNSNKKYGFTLIELMVAVIIIAVLAAVAVPQYKKAVLKSRFSTLMPLAQSVAKGNEVYYLANGEYADRKDKLDVEGPGTNPEGTQVNVVESDDYNYVIASRSGLPNNYIVYQAHSPKFAGNIHCEAEDENIPAMELCKSLGGQEIDGSQTDGYVTYVLEGTQGENDKLPSSFTKLAKTICANAAPADCIIDDTTHTVTTNTCSTGGRRYSLSSDGRFSYSSSNSYGGSCMSTRYDAEGNEIDKSVLSCVSGAVLNEDKTHCVPSLGGTYEERKVVDDQGYTIINRSCEELQDGQCVTTMQQTKGRLDSGGSFSNKRVCASEDLKDDGSCSAYTVLNGDKAYLNSTSIDDSQGHSVWYQECTHRAANGTCTSMQQGYSYTYAADGTTRTGSTHVSCTVSHRYDTNPCTGYTITYRDGNYTVTGSRTCEASKLNFDTFECASES